MSAPRQRALKTMDLSAPDSLLWAPRPMQQAPGHPVHEFGGVPGAQVALAAVLGVIGDGAEDQARSFMVDE